MTNSFIMAGIAWSSSQQDARTRSADQAESSEQIIDQQIHRSIQQSPQHSYSFSTFAKTAVQT